MVKDKVDPVGDEMLANFVVDSHMRSHPDKARHSQLPTASSLARHRLVVQICQPLRLHVLVYMCVVVPGNLHSRACLVGIGDSGE